MYGYVLEGFGYGLFGEGYQYLILSRDPKNLVHVRIKTKQGDIDVLVPKPKENGQQPTISTNYKNLMIG
jgi:hypothetical protein